MAVRDHGMRLRTVWLGADNEAVAHDLRRVFDEVHVHVPLEDFPRTLSDLRPDIGLAPLWGDDFDRCKSELHWIEYSAAGAATIAERLEPFDVIHDGVDGLLAKGRQNWSDAVRKLIREPNLRADIAARAKERIALDYDHRKRAEEWKAAFEWASEHRGIGA
jgi:glycosyltransferase involved in cell wall biosynthesis